ncbi:hypothetical protein BOTBODRAFT_166906 [Botryobasidium botryosum FD-172 SS1]|uniref:Uncharacterized protein n=1 Tax=Botryobasidium botryosum (strain FD-172 SS1) TaxID=930990 RepID=A0A067LWF9_BOTB1|nr:hypothetical protein BOTBODRAFT_166906 [Botryobasidium botryosum FD-172 SS1]
MHMVAPVVVLALLAPFAAAQDTWCGKPYKKGSPHITLPAESRFPIPPTSQGTLLDFRCAPTLKPFVHPEDDKTGSILIDAQVTHDIGGAYDAKTASDKFDFTATIDGVSSFKFSGLAVGVTTRASFDITRFTPRAEPYNLTCTASFHNGQTFHSTSKLFYLPPNPYGGSTTKVDYRTGGLLVRPKGKTDYEPIFPFGFYTSFGGYLATNPSALDDIKANGFNMIHPVPPFEDEAAANQVFDKMEELGLWLMYDMRWTYMNSTSVQEQINSIKKRSNLLLWYTADEPDGTSDPLNATQLAYNQINRLDGYHPVSLVLNCENYFFNKYASGADIILEDAYPLGINPTHSTVWDTECTDSYGDCGCDNCAGSFKDIGDRISAFKARARWSGRGRDLSVWAVPQAFGNETYWPRPPTGQEFTVEAVTAILHGSLAIVPWVAPSTPEITSAASALAKTLPTLQAYILDPAVTFAFTTTASSASSVSSASSASNFNVLKTFKILAARQSDASEMEIGLWLVPSGKALFIAVNLNSTPGSLSVDISGGSQGWVAEKVFDSGSGNEFAVSGGTVQLSLGGLGAVGYVLAPSSSATGAGPGSGTVVDAVARQDIVHHAELRYKLR